MGINIGVCLLGKSSSMQEEIPTEKQVSFKTYFVHTFFSESAPPKECGADIQSRCRRRLGSQTWVSYADRSYPETGISA